MTAVTCIHCSRGIRYEDGAWIDPEATGDDSIWRESCESHDTFTAEHEPRQAGLGVGHIWTERGCPAYRSSNPADCTCTSTS